MKKGIQKRVTALTLALGMVIALPLYADASTGATYAGSQVSTFAAGEAQAAAVKNDGSLWVWGANHSGQFGTTDWNYMSPTRVIEASVRACALGKEHSLILKTDGTVWACGNGQDGQIGNGNASGTYTFTQVLTDVKAITAGAHSSFAIKNDHTLWAWGDNSNGQLGTGDAQDVYSPVQIAADVMAVSSSDGHTLFVKTDGSLYATGNGKSGQLGSGLTASVTTPVRIMGDVQSASAGYNHSMALKSDGTLWAWGDNSFGQLGNGTLSNELEPIKVADEIKSVSAGQFFTAAVKKDGGIWGWGRNSGRQLGNGGGGNMIDVYGYACQSTPIRVTTFGEAVAAGRAFTIALKGDNTLWGWGDNEDAQLGNGAMSTWNTVAPILSSVALPATADTITDPQEMIQSTAHLVTAAPATARVSLNGAEITLSAYNVEGSNYVKLRDIAALLKGSNAQFDVTYDNARRQITLVTKQPYTVVGGELDSRLGTTQQVMTSTPSINVDGIAKTFNACNIQGNNYIKLRDIAAAVNFYIHFDEASFTILIDPTRKYGS